MQKLLPSLIRIFSTVFAVYALLAICCAIWQRTLLYHPTHFRDGASKVRWKLNNTVIGFALEAKAPAAIWLMLCGNGGQAADRLYALPCFPEGDSVYVLEYPGYGARPGHPSLKTMNAAAEEAFRELRRLHPDKPVCVLGESIGSGSASHLGTLPNPPEKIVLVVPFDQLSKVAAEHLPFLPAGLFLLDRWDNVEALQKYHGLVEIFGARDDQIIPVKHAMALAASLPNAQFHLVEGGHNEWSNEARVRFSGPQPAAAELATATPVTK